MIHNRYNNKNIILFKNNGEFLKKIFGELFSTHRYSKIWSCYEVWKIESSKVYLK